MKNNNDTRPEHGTALDNIRYAKRYLCDPNFAPAKFPDIDTAALHLDSAVRKLESPVTQPEQGWELETLASMCVAEIVINAVSDGGKLLERLAQIKIVKTLTLATSERDREIERLKQQSSLVDNLRIYDDNILKMAREEVCQTQTKLFSAQQQIEQLTKERDELEAALAAKGEK